MENAGLGTTHCFRPGTLPYPGDYSLQKPLQGVRQTRIHERAQGLRCVELNVNVPCLLKVCNEQSRLCSAYAWFCFLFHSLLPDHVWGSHCVNEMVCDMRWINIGQGAYETDSVPERRIDREIPAQGSASGCLISSILHYRYGSRRLSLASTASAPRFSTNRKCYYNIKTSSTDVETSRRRGLVASFQGSF